MTSKLSILGLWQWDNTIFDNMVLPAGVSLDSVRDNILYSFADLEVLYPSAPFMKTMIEIWSKKELPTWERVNKAAKAEYNPIENYDRIEEWTDNRKNTVSDKSVADGESRNSGTDKTDSEMNHYVAGYNDPSMVLNEKQTNKTDNTLGTKTEVDNTITRNGSGTDDLTHKGRVHGNIGVTTSQTMLLSEVELAPKLNVVDYIVNSFKMRFCIMVY